jgi:hypothetical protein
LDKCVDAFFEGVCGERAETAKQEYIQYAKKQGIGYSPQSSNLLFHSLSSQMNKIYGCSNHKDDAKK